MDEVLFTSEMGPQPKKHPTQRKSIIILMIGFLLIYLLYHINHERELHQQNQQAAERIKEIGGNVVWENRDSEMPFSWSALRVYNIFFPHPQLTGREWQLLQTFPEPVVIRIQGSDFGDQQFAELRQVENIKHIVLAGTSVSVEAITQYQQIHPAVSFEIGKPGNQRYEEIPSLERGMRYKMPY